MVHEPEVIPGKVKGESVHDARREALSRDPARAAGEAALVRLATRLYELRTSLQLTQEQLGERAGLDQASISDIENGDANPTVRTLGRVAAGLGVAASVLLDHAPIGIRFGHAVNLLEGIRWEGSKLQATVATVVPRRSQPQMKFGKMKLATRGKKIATGG